MTAPAIRLWDSATRAKVALRTPAPGAPVTLYVCGPTVYNRAHIGNARPAVVFDVLARLIRHLHGPDALVYARNVTDIDDKIMAAAAAEGVGVADIAARYERHYVEDMAALGVAPPDIAPRATAHVAQMIAMIAALVAKGVAYAAAGHVLFSTAADPDYGSLSRRPLDEMRAGARVEVAPFKRDPADFVLWKPSEPDQPGWDSPWGRGRPGWHIECSAMIAQHLGETIDIHGGGQDLIFPHHENEAAQSRCAHGGAPLARIWMHNGFLSMGAEKMSKSLGNVALVSDLLSQGWDGEVLRLALLSAHYRQPLEWTEGLLEQSKRTLDRLRSAVRRSAAEAARFAPREGAGPVPAEADRFAPREGAGPVPAEAARFTPREGAGPVPADIAPQVADALCDDLNTPEALAALGPLLDSLNSLLRDLDEGRPGDTGATIAISRALLLRSASLLGLTLEQSENDDADAMVIASISARRAAKAARDYATADRIRAELLAAGIALEDRPDGTTDWRRA
jgi:cysteinyl-tRNA synthetase